MNIKYEDLVQKCRKCEGIGRLRETPNAKETTCKSCDGSGERLTDSGQSLYKFIKFLKGKGLIS
jgi:DnaJ-class molecular chaperone